ncbi:hypothetical protein ACFL59_06345 [Planctomycetota bacterium]
MAIVVCQSCGEEERLRGTRRGDIIHVVCEACGARWDRDVSRRCCYCSSESLRYTPIPLWSSGRGTMRTPAGKRDSWACNDCGGRDVTRKK